MSERKISKKSLENLKISNQESNRITKESLEISLLQLLEKKELTKITISELVERAGVSRAAFYRNYDSKEEILQEIFQRTVQKITDKLAQFNMRTELYQVWLFLFKEVKKEARILSLAVDYNLEKLLTSAVFDFLKQNSSRKEASISYEFILEFGGGFCLIKWTKDGMKVPAEKDCIARLPLFPYRK